MVGLDYPGKQKKQTKKKPKQRKLERVSQLGQASLASQESSVKFSQVYRKGKIRREKRERNVCGCVCVCIPFFFTKSWWKKVFCRHHNRWSRCRVPERGWKQILDLAHGQSQMTHP
jgi:hypothetical protein